MKRVKVYDDGTVTVRVAVLTTARRRVLTAVKGLIAAAELARASKAAKAAHGVAVGALRGGEVNEYQRRFRDYLMPASEE